MKTLLYSIAALLLLASCSSTKSGYIIFDQPSDELIVKDKIKAFTFLKPGASIVLRTDTEIETDVITKETLNPIYTAIEKEFTRADYTVRDRKLFQKVFDEYERSEGSITDYSVLKEAMKTDLILEVITTADPAAYVSNRYKDKKGEQKTWKHGVFAEEGYTFECRLIMVETNDVVGVFSFQTPPIGDGTYVKMNKDGEYYSPKVKNKEAVSYTDATTIRNYLADDTRKMVAAVTADADIIGEWKVGSTTSFVFMPDNQVSIIKKGKVSPGTYSITHAGNSFVINLMIGDQLHRLSLRAHTESSMTLYHTDKGRQMRLVRGSKA
jgi:hypothetical protein